MKRKQLISSVSLAVMVLFTILFQSLHSYEHIVEQLSEPQCHHDYSDKNGQITHEHAKFDNCFVCNFAFASFVLPNLSEYSFQEFSDHFTKYFYSSDTVLYFSGTYRLLRGPPFLIVT